MSRADKQQQKQRQKRRAGWPGCRAAASANRRGRVALVVVAKSAGSVVYGWSPNLIFTCWRWLVNNIGCGFCWPAWQGSDLVDLGGVLEPQGREYAGCDASMSGPGQTSKMPGGGEMAAGRITVGTDPRMT